MKAKFFKLPPGGGTLYADKRLQHIQTLGSNPHKKNENSYAIKLIIFSVLLVSMFSFFSGAVKKVSKLYSAPKSKEFLNFLSSLNNPIIPANQGYTSLKTVPSSIDLSHTKGYVNDSVILDYPTRYNLREQPGKLPPIRDQGPTMSCQAFATYTSMESCLRPDEVWDFYEMDIYLNHGFDYIWGGNLLMNIAYLARWSGPLEQPIDYSMNRQKGTTIKHIQQVIFIPERDNPLNNETIKWFVMNHGGVYGEIHFSVDFHNYSNYSYYYTGEEPTNHGVVIVGWDDNYDKNNFLITPPGNGAFIGQNGWGADWGDNGYYYISYYDNAILPQASYNNAEDVNNYDTIYQYDPLGYVSAVGSRKTYWGANVFTAVNNRPLVAASFYVTGTEVEYELYIYNNLHGSNPVEGDIISANSGIFEYPGYYTVKLDPAVPVNTGEQFSVVIKYHNSRYRFPVAIEQHIPGWSSAATANRGESFVSQNGIDWYDLIDMYPYSNVCIKAFSLGYPRAIVNLQVERQQNKGIISFNIENIENSPVERVMIYRKDNNGNYHALYKVLRSEFQNNTYTLEDKYILDVNGTYTYRLDVLTSSGLIYGRSEEVTI